MTATADDTIAVGTKVVLRRKRSSDARDDYQWRCDPDLARYDGAPPLRMSYSDFLSTFSYELSNVSPYRETFAIEDEHENHIGNIMYYNADLRRGDAELGVSIGERLRWGQGYGTDAVMTFLRFLFQDTDLRRIYLHTLEWNLRAQRSFQKAGFATVKTSWRNGLKFVVMEVEREKFLEEKGPPKQSG